MVAWFLKIAPSLEVLIVYVEEDYGRRRTLLPQLLAMAANAWLSNSVRTFKLPCCCPLSQDSRGMQAATFCLSLDSTTAHQAEALWSALGRLKKLRDITFDPIEMLPKTNGPLHRPYFLSRQSFEHYN